MARRGELTDEAWEQIAPLLPENGRRGKQWRGRLLLRRRGIPHTIPERRDQKERRAGRPGRPPSFDAETYARRNVAERCVNRLKQWRAVATRYEKRAANYRATVTVAALLIWVTS